MNNSIRKRVDQVFQNTYFDSSQNLREQTNEDKNVLNLIFELEEYLEKETQSEENELFATSTLGDLYRVINKPEESIHYHSQYLRLISDDEKKQVPAFIKLGQSYKYADEFKKALLCFEKAESVINTHSFNEYTDYLEHQRGKCYMEMRYYNWAKSSFEKALDLRNKKNVLKSIESTKEALNLCNEKLNLQV
ncbi:hypothetical protein [Salinicoccus sp. HZC-1]|uniref:hypothetical protein n=1 Tax=Salinicoccus sp. HZC-1 TaxID=3385497 RepID=UPI00398B6F92